MTEVDTCRSDYTGTATRNFAEPAFGGDPAFVAQEEIDEHGKTTKTDILTAENAEDGEKKAAQLHDDTTPYSTDSQLSTINLQLRRKYYFDGGQVEMAAELVYELDADGKQLRVVKLTDYSALLLYYAA